LYYNKKLFDENGVPYPPDRWNFRDFVNTAKKLTKGKQYGFKFANWMPGWVTWLWNQGGDVLSPDGTRAAGYCDSESNTKAVEFLLQLTDKDKVAPNLSAAAAMGVDLFTNGTAAMEVSGHWAMVGYSAAPKDDNGKPLLDLRDVGVTFLPTELPESKTVIYAAGYAITRNCKDPKLAWEFIRFMTSAKNQRRLNKTGIAVSGRLDVSRENATNDREKKFLQIIPTARVPWGSRVERYEYVETVGQKMLDAVLLNGKPPRLALEQMAEEIDREFAK
jgi:multiple sugar transport system substrate-binding protein